jgi:hypothetical protein
MKKPKEFNKIIALIGTIVILVGFSAGESLGLPKLQVWSPGGVAGDSGDDEDTWFVSGTPFDLLVIGDGPQTVSITDLMLIVSVPQGSMGIITGTGLGTGKWYATKSEFLDPIGYSPNEHYPFKDDVSDFIVYDIGDFLATDPKTTVYDYDAETGDTSGSGDGWIKEYKVSFEGYEWLHFDVIGLVTIEEKPGETEITRSFWDINPPSHDVSTGVPPKVPEPSTLILLGAGLVGLGLWGRKRFRGLKS